MTNRLISFSVFLAAVILSLSAFVFVSNVHAQSGSANPSFYPLVPCPTCATQAYPTVFGGATPPAAGSASTQPMVTSPNAAPSMAPCDASIASDNAKKSKHKKKKKGAVSNSMEKILKLLIDLINKLMELLGGGKISMPSEPGSTPDISAAPLPPVESPDNNPGNNPGSNPQPQPSMSEGTPCPPAAEPSTPASGGQQPSTSSAPTVSGTMPSGAAVNPSGAASSGTGAPTDATCGGSANTPSAPVTGYTLAQCEDFNNGLGAFEGYEGGGGSTVVGGGRKASQCTAAGGMLTLTQTADGSTCGGQMSSFGQKYGYWEVRMKTYSTGSGGSAPHPVLILWPDTDWNDGELDFFEGNLGESGAEVFLHCVGNPSSNCYNTKLDVDYTQWHTYGFEWTAAGFTGFIDGKQVYTTDGKGSNPSVNMHMTIQLDNLTGNTPVSPGKMDIDWVHMYKK